jgi:LysR family hydrogen peroxide-inducible transcriptional activator
LTVPRDQTLARVGTVRKHNLEHEQFLCLNPAYLLLQQVAPLSQAVGARMRDEIDGTGLDAIRQMVALAMGGAHAAALYSIGN